MMGSDWLSHALEASPQNIAGPKSDRLLWREASEGSEAFRELGSRAQHWPSFGHLLQDAFQTFYKSAPTLRPESELSEDAQANRPYVAKLLEDTATAELRTSTVYDELASAVATLAAGRRLAEEIAQNKDLERSMREKRTPPPGAQGKLHKAVHKAAREGAQASEEAQAALVAWGTDPAALRRVPLGQRVDLARQLASPRFRRLAELIGRMRNLAQSRQAGALRHRSDELYSVTSGDDLGRVLPVELSQLGHPLRRLDFGRKLLERELLQYEVRPLRKEGRGPIVAMIDCSGSMSGARIEWATAVALALADTARRQKRDFAACLFNTEVAAEFSFARGKVDPRELLRLATAGADGGTDFQKPLEWALRVQEDARFRRGDLVLITDGACRLEDAFCGRLMAAKKERGLRVLSILIGGASEELSRWSDRVWAVAQPEDEAAGEMFAELAS